MNLDFFDDLLDPDFRLKNIFFLRKGLIVEHVFFDFDKGKNIFCFVKDNRFLGIKKNILYETNNKTISEKLSLKDAFGLYPLWIWCGKHNNENYLCLQIELCDLYANEYKEYTIQISVQKKSLILYKMERIT